MNTAMLSAVVPWWAQALAIIFIVVCIFLIMLVLLQKGRGGGLASAFGGEGGQSAFGSKTGDVFTWITISVVVAFGLLAMILTKTYKPVAEEELTGGESLNSQQPVAPEAPATEPAATAPATTGGESSTEAGTATPAAEPATAPATDAAATTPATTDSESSAAAGATTESVEPEVPATN